MNPVQFLFSILAPFLIGSPGDISGFQVSAEEWYNNSSVKRFIEKYWFMPLLLAVLYPVATQQVQKLKDRIGDQNGDGDEDIYDLLDTLLEKRRIKNTLQQVNNGQ